MKPPVVIVGMGEMGGVFARGLLGAGHPVHPALRNTSLPKLAQALPDPGQRLTATAPLFTEYAAQQPDYVKVWLMWSMHFSPEVRAQYQKFETRVIDALGKMITEGTGSDGSAEDIQDRARMILASSAFLAKMVFDGVSEKRRKAFVEHVLEPLAATA